MLSVLRNAWALMLGVLLLMIGNGLQGTLLGVRGSLEGVSSLSMGYVMSAYFVGFLGGSKITPWLLKRVGHVRVFAAYGSLVSAAFILYPVHIEPVFWWLLRYMVGFCFSGLYVVAESWINDSSTNENRGQALSLYTIMQMAGLVTGQLLLNVSDPAGYQLFILISVLVSISIAPVLLSVSPTPLFQTARPMSLRELFGVSPLGCVGVFIMGSVYATLYGMASVYAAQRDFSIQQVSYFLTAIFLGGLASQFPVGWLSDRMDRRHLIFLLTTSGAIAAITAWFWAASSFKLLLVLSFLIGSAANPLYALLIAYTNDHLKTEHMSAASGGLLFLNGVGAMGGPILIGYLMTHLGVDSFFVFIAILMGLIGLYSLYRMTQTEAIAIADTTSYIPIANTVSQVAVELAYEGHETSTSQVAK